MRNPRVGLLPFYIELYDKSLPDKRPRFDQFHQTMVRELRERDLEVMTVPLCRIKTEFEEAVALFERAQVDAIVTLHLAYSPSLESIEALAKTALPLVVLDTTPTHDLGPAQDPQEIMYNHGIHGVQDMCNLLLRSKKPFQIEAGHWERSDVLDRVAAWTKSSRLAASMRKARVGLIGSPFKGMGDFALPLKEFKKTIGIETIPFDANEFRSLLSEISEEAVDEEVKGDCRSFCVEGVNTNAHRNTTRAALAIRRWIEKQNLSAFTFNFLDVDRASGLPTVPFLEASKAMARGVGYAGEGDVLTAALVGTLGSAYPTSFTEMFCPDWKHNSIFLAHMGEMNTNLTEGSPKLMVKPFEFGDVENPVVAVGRFRGGAACLVNLAPGPDHSYTLIVAPVTMLKFEGQDSMSDWVHGWFKPDVPIADFLQQYSRVGGTHHLALSYGAGSQELLRFGELMGWNTVLLK